MKEKTIWEKIVAWFNSLCITLFEIEIDVEVKEPKKSRKKYDTTKFTQYHYDVIMEEYEYMQNHNKHLPKGNIGRIDTEELTALLNARLSLDKGRTAYSRIWTGKVNREDLPNQLSMDL